MEKIFIRERINIINYKNENQGLIYTSSDADILGGAVNVVLEADVGGWYQLTFDMPSYIFVEGKPISNPLLKNLFPLAKLQYTRVIKEGDEEKELILYFIVQPQVGSRDDSGIVLQSFTCIDYPRHVLSKAKNGITIGEDTIDEELSLTPNNEVPEVEGDSYWIKAPVQSRIDFNTFDEITIWGDAKPGAFAYLKSTGQAYRLIGTKVDYYSVNADGSKNYENWYPLKENETYSIVDGEPVPEPIWCPDWGGYPMEPDVNNYEYGDIDINDLDSISVQFYWDVIWFEEGKLMGRYDGVTYEEDSRLAYSVYESLDYEFPDSFMGSYFKAENLREDVPTQIEGATAYVIETGTIFRWNGSDWEDTHENKREFFKTKEVLKGKWTKLDPQLAYLSPNNAENYLKYILKDTEWSVGTCDKIMVDTSTVEFDETGVVTPKQQELVADLSFEGSNAYNAISDLCDVFKCYARFDHVNKTVSLKAVPGNDNGMRFTWRDNLASTTITQDGEKAVSKLWVYGGEDLISQQVISECNRMNPNFYLADYLSLADLEERVKKPVLDNYAKVSTEYTWEQLSSQTLSEDGRRIPLVNTFNAGELTVTSWRTGAIPEVNTLSDLPATGSLGQMIFVIDENSYWAWFPEGNAWYDTQLDVEPDDTTTKIKFEQRYDWNGTEWVDKGQFYHWYEVVSPYGDNFIMDFSYFLDRKLITEEQVEDIKYNYILPMSRLNKKRVPLMEEYDNLNEEYLNWSNVYDESKISRDAIDQSLKTTYTIKKEDNDGLISIVETGVYKYPPGAHIKTGGWVQSTAVYSEVDAPEVANYAALKTNYPDPTVGQRVKVKDEVMVYFYDSPITFDDTISAYLGWIEDDVEREGFDNRKSTLLQSPMGDLVADIRGQGLFEKLREEELINDEERASLAPWYNPPANINDLPAGPVGDPTETSLAHSYYNSLSRYIAEELNMEDALDRMEYIETQLALNLEKQEILLNHVNELNAKLRENYGDFVVEGTFTDETMVWRYNLWYAGLKALELYHRPLVTYELGVTDVSGLPEYRTVTSDIYHDIVYRLNKPELVLPEPGDYCYVTDNTLGLVQERANITNISRNLSDYSQNQITIQTVDTNTEDLIGKLVTAANTVYSKQEIYNRSAIINKDGTIATDSISDTMEENSGNLSLSSQNGTIIVGESGITAIDRDNAKNRMQYTGKGIYATSNGGVTWSNIVSAGKISIKNLEAGSIDANNISLTNIGHESSIVIDGSGITALNYTNGKIDPDFSNTPNNDKISFFLDAKNGYAFFRGNIEAGAGHIGGWTIRTGELYNNNVGMRSSDNGNEYAFWAGSSTPSNNSPFWVKHNGEMRATDATVTGTITATRGKIGNWTINNGSISNGVTSLNSDGSFTSGNFRVDRNGNVFANNITANGGTFSNVTVRGNIHATTFSADSGAVGGWTINPNQLRGGYVSGGTINGSSIVGATINISERFKVSPNSGPELSNNVGFLTFSQSNHPWISGINVNQLNGITFRDGNNINNIGKAYGAINIANVSGGRSLRIGGYSGTGAVLFAGTSSAPSADPNQIYLYGTKGGDGSNKSSSGIYAYASGGSFRVNAGRNIHLFAESRITFEGKSYYFGNVPWTPSISPSTLSIKENVKKADTGNLLDILSQIKFYNYDYKLPSLKNHLGFGYIIDYLEKIPGIDNYLLFKEVEIDGEKTKVITEETLLNFMLASIVEINKKIH